MRNLFRCGAAAILLAALAGLTACTAGGAGAPARSPTAMTDAQILAHYQNGTNGNRSTPYDTLVKSLNPVAYLRLDEIAPGPDTAINLGDLRSGGLATHTAEARHPASSALGRADDGAAAYHNRNGNSTTTMRFN